MQKKFNLFQVSLKCALDSLFSISVSFQDRKKEEIGKKIDRHFFMRFFVNLFRLQLKFDHIKAIERV